MAVWLEAPQLPMYFMKVGICVERTTVISVIFKYLGITKHLQSNELSF